MIAYPEGNQPLVTDSEQRLYHKWNQLIFAKYGNIGSVPYPEGTEPMQSDDEHRSKVKIDAIYHELHGRPPFPGTGLTAYWKLDETGGNDRVDSSSGGFDLSEGGGGPVGSAAGKLNNAASFDGSTANWLSRANPDLVSDGNPLTLSAWVKLNAIDVDFGLVGKHAAGDGYLLYYNAAENAFCFKQADSSGPNEDQIVSTLPVSADTWYHIVCGYDGTNHFIQINGGARESDDGLAATNAAHDFKIGNDSVGNVLNGLIDEVGLWLGTALSSDEAIDLYNSGSPLPYNP